MLLKVVQLRRLVSSCCAKKKIVASHLTKSHIFIQHIFYSFFRKKVGSGMKLDVTHVKLSFCSLFRCHGNPQLQHFLCGRAAQKMVWQCERLHGKEERADWQRDSEEEIEATMKLTLFIIVTFISVAASRVSTIHVIVSQMLCSAHLFFSTYTFFA